MNFNFLPLHAAIYDKTAKSQLKSRAAALAVYLLINPASVCALDFRRLPLYDLCAW